ncbi:MAG: SDR family oxidoreductase [Nitrososphaerota archaeon]
MTFGIYKPVKTLRYMLEGRVCIISGASSEIGEATVRELLAYGAFVYAGARRLELLLKWWNAWVKTFGDGRVWVQRLDVTDESSVRNFTEAALSRHGRVDALINLAGYPIESSLWNTPLTDLTYEEISKVFRVDLGGSFLLSKSVIPVMVRNRHGVIVNISSTPALSGHSRGAAYSIAKAALHALTRHIASEYGAYGVRSYTLALGNIETQATRTVMESMYEELATESPAKRWGKPDEVASVIALLCSDKMSYVNGQTIVVDGGTVML